MKGRVQNRQRLLQKGTSPANTASKMLWSSLRAGQNVGAARPHVSDTDCFLQRVRFVFLWFCSISFSLKKNAQQNAVAEKIQGVSIY